MHVLVLGLALACAATLSTLALPPTAYGFALGGSADLRTEPNNFYSFDESEITWKFSDNFLAAFPSQVRTQVRLAFEEWSVASTSLLRRDSPRYHWVRNNGVREVHDLRSTVTHEIGHALGSQHPDASWFNNDLRKNFRYSAGGDLIAAPPLGGEILNEGFEPGTLPDTKPPKGIQRGEYWRTLSKDELLFLDYAYNRRLTFREVSGNTPAQIIVTAYNLDGQSESNALGQAVLNVVDRDPDDPTQGSRISSVTLTINAHPHSREHGIDAGGGSWHVVNQTGKGINRLSIRTQGTSNPQPLWVSLSIDPFNFTEYEPAVTIPPFNFENVGHIFSHSSGSFVPDGSSFGVTLIQDVWDWFVTSATARATDGDIIPLSVITFTPFYRTDRPLFTAPVPINAPSSILIPKVEPQVLARGLKLVNSDKTTRMNGIALADVEGLGIEAGDVHLKTWKRLVREHRVHNLNVAPFVLGPGEEFYLLFEGDECELPRDVLERGNYLVLDLPGLLDREILAWAQSHDGNFLVQSLGLINDEPIVGRTLSEKSDYPLRKPLPPQRIPKRIIQSK